MEKEFKKEFKEFTKENYGFLDGKMFRDYNDDLCIIKVTANDKEFNLHYYGIHHMEYYDYIVTQPWGNLFHISNDIIFFLDDINPNNLRKVKEIDEKEYQKLKSVISFKRIRLMT